jgi:hypothetical protein
MSLDDEVAKYLPEFADVKVEEKDSSGRTVLVPPKRPLKIRDLMTHTSGATSEPIVKRALPLREAEILHILHAHHNGVGGDAEVQEVIDIEETAGARTHQDFPIPQPHAQRADDIHRKARAGADGHGLGVSEELHLLRTGIGTGENRCSFLQFVRLQALAPQKDIKRRPGNHLQGLPAAPHNTGNAPFRQHFIGPFCREPTKREGLALPQCSKRLNQRSSHSAAASFRLRRG